MILRLVLIKMQHENFVYIYLNFIFLITIPFVTFLFIALYGRLLARKGLFLISTLNLAILWISFSTLFYYSIIYGIIIEFTLFEWVDMGMGFDFNFLIDSLSVEMALVVLTISSCVILFSFDYMGEDAHLVRFISYLFLFVFFMLFLVFSANLLQFFIGWEGVGLVSFFLIDFWFTRLEANRSALKAILFNRIGDIGFILGVVSIFFIFGSVDFIVLNGLDWAYFRECTSTISIEYILLFLFFGAMAKSAQLGLHAWLPDAMEGPTPVSALLHSATMVTVGVYLLLRIAPVVSQCVIVPNFITLMGGFTALIAAMIALFQEDIKKIIAYSTCSQLGLLMASIGVFNFNGCFFHLTTHAFFKALLFLTAGCIIHSVVNEQDIRKMGGILDYTKLTGLCTIVGTFGLVGFPFFSGFYSKEYILFYFLNFSDLLFFKLIFITLMLASIFTIGYSFKLFYLVFLSQYRNSKIRLLSISDSPLLTNCVLVILSIFTIFFGYVFLDGYIGVGDNKWEGVFELKNNIIDVFLGLEGEGFLVKNFLIFVIIFVAYFFYKWKDNFLLVQKWVTSLLKIQNPRFVQRGFVSPIVTQFLKIILNLSLKVFSFFSEKFWFASLYRSMVDLFYSISYGTLQLKLERGIFEQWTTFFFISFVSLNNFIGKLGTLGSLSSNLLTFFYCFVVILSLIFNNIFFFKLLVLVAFFLVIDQYFIQENRH
jgi:proton-translocating NADH-quinone oxidoreductase chain L